MKIKEGPGLLAPFAKGVMEVTRRHQTVWRRGLAAALAAWMALSWLYSYYANHFSHYSVLYGSIGAVIVVLIWLNLTAVTLILGAEVNGVLISMRKDENALKF